MIEATAAPARTHKVFYGWWIVLSGLVLQTLNGGLYYYGFGAYFLPVAQEFSANATALSGVFSLSRLESGILGPIQGWITDRWGPRRLMLVGLTMMGLGFMALSQVPTLTLFYVVFIGLVTTGGALGLAFPLNVAVGNWFNRKSGSAFGVMSAGVGIGGFLVPAIAWVIANFGWRTATFASGVAVLAIGLPLSLVVRHRPEPYGYAPDGDAVAPARAPSGAAASVLAVDGMTTGEAVRTAAFWLLAVAFTMRMMVTNAMLVHQIPYLVQIGFSLQAAASFLGLNGVISLLGRVSYGVLGDRMPKRYIFAVGHAAMTVGLLFLASAHSTWQVMVFLIVYAPAFGGLVALSPAMQGQYFGRKAFGSIQGTMGLIQMVGTIGGPLLAGVLYDTLHSYRIAFTIFAVGNLFATGLILLARPPGRRGGR